MDYKETLPVRSFTHLALLLLLHLSKIGGYDHGSKPLSVCWALVTLGHVYPHWQNLQRNVYMMGRGNWNISSEKKDYSFQQLEKRFIFRFLCDNNRQRKMCRSFHFSSSYQPPGNKPFNRLSIVCDYCCLLFTLALKVGDVVCYGYLFHIMFH